MILTDNFNIIPLSDTAITIDFGNVIDEGINKKALAIFDRLCSHPFNGMIEAVPAYSSVTVYYDLMVVRKHAVGKSIFDYLSKQLSQVAEGIGEQRSSRENLVRIPVCYDREFGLDIGIVESTKGINMDELIRIHTSNTYRVYMLGFLPGFPYMGEVEEKLVMPRRDEPRIRVDAGSVGIAGKQTGVYPVDCPGGWQIIGRTPLKIFDPQAESPTLLNAGDKVQFFSINRDEFENY